MILHKNFIKFISHNFIWIYLSCLSLVFIINQLLPSYFNYRSSEALSYVVGDEWCNVKYQGLGLHCFSDFHYPIQFASSESPWSGLQNGYPPLGLLFFKPFEYIISIFPSGVIPVIFYISVLVVATLFPIFQAKRKKVLNNRETLFAIISVITCGPFLMAIDRGNSQLICIPLLYLFFSSILENKIKISIIYGVILFLLKPQMIMLGAIYISFRLIKIFFLWTTLCLTSMILSFIVYYDNFLNNIIDWLHQLLAYQSHSNAGSPNPVNLSLANTWSLFWRICFTVFPKLTTKDPIGHWEYYSIFITFLILTSIVATLYFFGNRRDIAINLLLVTSLPIFLPNVVYAYYLTMYIPLFIVLYIDESKNRKFEEKNIVSQIIARLSGNSFTNNILLVSFILTIFIPWSIPWKIIPYFSSLEWSEIGINWTIGQFILVLYFILSNFSRISK